MTNLSDRVGPSGVPSSNNPTFTGDMTVAGSVDATDFTGDGSSLTGIVAGLAWSRKTTTYAASNNDAIIADTSGGAWTLTLPASPSVGDLVRVADGANWESNNLTVARNGSTIAGAAEDTTMDIPSASVDFVYDGSTWQVYVMIGTVSTNLDATIITSGILNNDRLGISADLDFIGVDSDKLALRGAISEFVGTTALPIAGGSLTGDLQVKGVRETTQALAGTTPEIDPTNGTIATWTLSGSSTPTFAAGWADGESVLLMVDDGGSHVISSFPTMQWAGGSAPTLATTGYSVMTIWKVGGGFYGTSAGDMS
jgi:hypothetical protein